MLADEIDVTLLQNGGIEDLQDGRGAVYRSGIDILLYWLNKKFGELEVETIIRVIVEFMNFSRVSTETIDQGLVNGTMHKH